MENKIPPTSPNIPNPPIDPNANIVRNWLTGIGVALLVIVGITFALHRNDTLSPVVANDMSSSSAVTGTTSTSGAALAPNATPGSSAAFASLRGTVTTASMGETLTLSRQPAGASVAIASMSLYKRSWVAIKNAQGTILGAALFPAGATSGTVSLLRDTVAGQQYEAVIYVDDGDKVFDLHKDMLVTAVDGSPVNAMFTAQ